MAISMVKEYSNTSFIDFLFLILKFEMRKNMAANYFLSQHKNDKKVD